MQRRTFLLASSAAGLALSACASAPTRYVIGVAQLDAALAGRFPRRYGVAGLLDVQLQAPRLTLLPERNRIAAALPLRAEGALLQGREHTGLLDVDFALRYDATDHTLRAHALHLNTLRLDGVHGARAQLLTRYGQQLADGALGDVVLYQLRPKDLALLGGLGLTPQQLTVTAQGLAVQLGAAAR